MSSEFKYCPFSNSPKMPSLAKDNFLKFYFVIHHFAFLFTFQGNRRLRATSLGGKSSLVRSGEHAIIDPTDAQTLYIFDSRGKHLRTADVLTKQTLVKFMYDDSDKLSGTFQDLWCCGVHTKFDDCCQS